MAQTTRASLGRATSEPSGKYMCSCSRRNSFTCEAIDRSPISSRKSVPPAAWAMSPARDWSAPVKAPFL
ncbi:MAG: hypothetical protein AW07_01285 [Candidatus Accumulibacter sp. SK-11]|nr:MAG: hypothetical protein AW07_01285 [Candidatus Accumulibacter sp. SK-11]